VSDYRIRITVRNARLLRAIEAAGHQPGHHFAMAAGISYGGHLLPYLNLTRSPLNREGLLRECAWALCDFLGASPSDLWSDEQLHPLQKNHANVDMDFGQLGALMHFHGHAIDPVQVASKDQAKRLLLHSLETLTPKESKVVYARFFEDWTLEELADHFNLTRERIRQVEQKALRKLRAEFRCSPDLKGTADIIGGVVNA
jgi:RNA polymerase sigma factor (sigma-70 family)